MIREYRTITSVSGPLITVRRVEGVACGELAELELPTGEVRRCRVLEINGGAAVVQLFGRTDGVRPSESRVRFLGRPLELAVSDDMLGRVFSGMGEPIDGGPELLAEALRNINGLPTNPAARALPSEPIQTGISAIDGLNALVRGQKLSIFSGSGLPHAELAARIVRQAAAPEEESGIAVVFAAIGSTFEDADFFVREFRRAGAADKTVLFMNLADHPVAERITTPRMALTAAEYLAFERDMHVLVILTDMTAYAEALREISAARRETPGRLGYPGYLYADFASLFERAGTRLGKDGSITLIPIFTMPGDDVRHPVPDIAGCVSEGQITLSRELHRRGISPPVDALNSVSRLADRAVGESRAAAARELLSAYAAGRDARALAAASGEAALSRAERLLAGFADEFETRYIAQEKDISRDAGETFDLGLGLLSALSKA